MIRRLLYAAVIAALLAINALTWLKTHPTAAANAATAATAPKQLWTCGMHPQVIQDHPGICPICHMKLTPLVVRDTSAPAAAAQRTVAYWWDPMLGPSSITDHPGKSAMGMDLVPVYSDSLSAGPGVRIDPAVVQNMGVLTAPVTRGPLDVSVRAAGMLEVPEPAQHDISVTLDGYVQRLYADTDGMAVTKGQVLLDFYSSQLPPIEEELFAADRELKSLWPIASDTNRLRQQALVDVAREKLRAIGIADQDIDAITLSRREQPTVPLRSPCDGHVVDKTVVQGSAVQAGARLMRIEDHSRLWLDAQVYEDQIPLITLGQKVVAAVDGAPGQSFIGAVDFIHPHLDHMTRTALVRAVLDNPGHVLRPGMYADVRIITRPLTNAVLAPRSAVIDTGTRQIAFVADSTNPGHFEPRQLQTGLVGDDDQLQIISGLAPGEMVVTSGQFLMDVESRTTEAIQKLRGTSAR